MPSSSNEIRNGKRMRKSKTKENVTSTARTDNLILFSYRISCAITEMSHIAVNRSIFLDIYIYSMRFHLKFGSFWLNLTVHDSANSSQTGRLTTFIYYVHMEPNIIPDIAPFYFLIAIAKSYDILKQFSMCLIYYI